LRESATIGVEQKSPILTPGDRQIATGDKLAARRGGDPVHLRDHGFRQADDRLHQTRALLQERVVIGPSSIGVLAMRRHFFEVVAGAECRTVGGYHDRAYAIVLARSVEG
jgi:hypothetical protein